MPPAPSTPAPQRRSLVTGGAGFIGSHLVERLLARGDLVTVVDNLSTGRRDNLPQAHPALRFIEADLADVLPAFGRGETFDEIYHLAAAVGVRLVVSDPFKAIETNIVDTVALLRFAMAQKSVAPRTLIASSSEVYGKSTHAPFREDDDVLYGPTTVPRWSYACSKAIDEFLALAAFRQSRLPVVVTRFFNTVGPRQVGDYGMVLPRFVRAALASEPIEIHGDGSQSRCFCDVRDVAELLPRLLAASEAPGKVFNVGREEPISILDLARLVLRVTGSNSPITHVPYERAFGPEFEDLRQRRPDCSRVRAVAAFSPSITLEQTIRDIARTLGAQITRATPSA